MKNVLVHKGDTTGLYPEYMTKRKGYFSHRFPTLPEYVVASSEDRQENEKLYAYQKKIWLQLGWHGSKSKHQTHYQWCLNNMVRAGASLHVRQYARDIDSTNGKRIQVVYIRPRAANSCSLSYLDPYDETKIDGTCNVVGLDAADYRLSLSAEPTNKADVFYTDPGCASAVRGHERWDGIPAWGNEEDPQQPFGKTREDQCVWLHRLCQISPGAITLDKRWKLYGAWLEEEHLAVAGHEGEGRPLQKKVLPLDTTFEVCCPCGHGYRMDCVHQEFQEES